MSRARSVPDKHPSAPRGSLDHHEFYRLSHARWISTSPLVSPVSEMNVEVPSPAASPVLRALGRLYPVSPHSLHALPTDVHSVDYSP